MSTPGRMNGGWEWLARAVLMTISLLVALGAAEVVTRVFFPLNGGMDNVMLDGTPVTDWVAPNTVYRQISNEYDARTTITSKGHRVPGTDGNPQVVFVGDSFTFGYGLKDDETFASVYCAEKQVSCVNLGIPGSGTSRQLARLRTFLEKHHWRPKQVKWFFFGMSGSFSAGNDFVDNYETGRRQTAEAPAAPAAPAPVTRPSLAGRLIGLQSLLLDNSYLMRHVKFRWGPLLKSLLVDPPDASRMADALAYTREGLYGLDQTSREFGFAYEIYLIVPVQDLLRGTAHQTLETLNSVSPKPVISTAPALADSPSSYYFAYDGHLNPQGARRVAEYLLSHDE